MEKVRRPGKKAIVLAGFLLVVVLLSTVLAVLAFGTKRTAFPRGIVTLTFDDGYASAYANGFPIRQRYGLPATDSVVTGWVDTTPEYMTTEQCSNYLRAGDELSSETVNHPFLTRQSPAQVDYQLSASKAWLEQRFGPCPDFTIPYDDYNDSVIAAVKQHYKSARSSDPGYNTRTNLYYYDILVKVVYKTTTNAQVERCVRTALNNHYWLVLEYHGVDDSGASDSVSPADLEAQMRFIHQSGIACRTTRQAITEVAPYLGP